jgi:hypothetical protein
MLLPTTGNQILCNRHNIAAHETGPALTIGQAGRYLHNIQHGDNAATG